MGTSDVHQALTRVTQKLEELAIPYAICGGMAVNAHGYQRTTTGVDLLLTPEGMRGSGLLRSGSVGSRSLRAAEGCSMPPRGCRFASC